MWSGTNAPACASTCGRAQLETIRAAPIPIILRTSEMAAQPIELDSIQPLVIYLEKGDILAEPRALALWRNRQLATTRRTRSFRNQKAAICERCPPYTFFISCPYSRLAVLKPVLCGRLYGGKRMTREALLNSWKEIARYVGRSERTVQRWEKQFGFPVRRPAGRARSAVIAMPSEIQRWSTGTTVSGANG